MQNDTQPPVAPQPAPPPITTPDAIGAATVQSPAALPAQRRSIGWIIGLSVLGVANLVTLGLPWLFTLFLYLQPPDQVTGLEYVFLLLWPLYFVGLVLPFVNIAVLAIYLWRRKPGRIARILAIIGIILSALYAGWSLVPYFTSAPMY